VLASAARAHLGQAEVAQLAVAGVELARMQLTVAWTKPAHTRLALRPPSSPWLGRISPARSSDGQPAAAFSTGAASSAPPASSTPVNFVLDELLFSQQQGDVALKPHIANICFKCFKCFRGIQVFHADIAKVDQDVAYVAMVVHVCCKLLFPLFHLFF